MDRHNTIIFSISGYLNHKDGQDEKRDVVKYKSRIQTNSFINYSVRHKRVLMMSERERERERERGRD